jgi:hypothetical protein
MGTSTVLATLGGGYLGYKIATGQAHRKANTFVDTLQNPFHKDIASILDPITKAREAGTLTYQQVLDAQTAFNKRLTAFEDEAFNFSLKGGDQERVYKQALGETGNLTPIIASWKKSFSDDIAKLRPAEETTPEKPPTMESVTPGRTPIQQALLAAERERKKSLGAGYKSTFLGGAKNKPLMQRMTLGGY